MKNIAFAWGRASQSDVPAHLMCVEGIFDVRKSILKFSGIFFPKKF